MASTYNRLGLLKEAKLRYTLGDPVHGPDHWLAVEDAAIEMAAELGGDVEIASIFGLLHDCRREDSDHDPEHGARAAALAVELRGKLFDLPKVRMQKLIDALYWHDAGLVVQDVDVMCCWAADRLQLTRVGIVPERSYFCDRTWPLVQRMLEEQRVAASTSAPASTTATTARPSASGFFVSANQHPILHLVDNTTPTTWMSDQMHDFIHLAAVRAALST